MMAAALDASNASMYNSEAMSIGAQEINDEDQKIEYFGFVKGNIVGIRYYSGLVSNKEMVALVREPHNPYDRNAVRVNNIMGQQVGHIKKDMARALAQVVDRELASVEGLVPFGASNVYSMAVEISFWGDPVNKERTIQTMRSCGYHVIQELPNSQKKSGQSSSQYNYARAKTLATKITPDQMKYELDGLFEKLKEVDQSSEEDGCSAIKSKLYQHQKQALAWMRKREGGTELPPFWEEKKPNAKTAAKVNGQTVYYNTVTNHSTTDKPKTVKGGILADDMGLGKTLITISLILGNSSIGKPMHKLIKNTKVENLDEKSKAVEVEKVIVEAKQKDVVPEVPKLPALVTLQLPASIVKVKVSKSVKKKIVESQKDDDDVIFVKEENIVSTHRTTGRSRRATKRPSRYIDEPEIYEDEEIENIPQAVKKTSNKAAGRKKLKSITDEEYVPVEEPKQSLPPSTFEDSYIHGSDLQFVREKVSHDQPRATLIICPLSVIGNWVGQVEEHVHSNATVNILVYHGPEKSRITGNMLSQQDIVITTYQTVAQEIKKAGSHKSKLLTTDWLRIVLDEGHIIRNPRSQQSKACCALKSEHKWILTGTPIQNSTKDLFSIISFLKIDPFTAPEWWTRTIERPIRNGDASALKRIRCLLGAICMRRTKQQKVNGKPIVKMPPKDIFLQTIDLDNREREMYNRMDNVSKQVMRNLVSDGQEKIRYADVLVLIMRLRQICCHPSLAKAALEALDTGGLITKKAKELATKLICMMEAGSLDDCCVCLDSVTAPVITKCSHVFCKLCICGVIANERRGGDGARCPLCRKPVRESELIEPAEDDEKSDQNASTSLQQSSKVNALMFELLKLDKEEPDVKSLVVSQFTEYLRIIESHLVANGIPCVLYHGGMTRKSREEAIWQLQSGYAKVMLLTLKAGGVGLNLTAASQVFLMEPSWNPAAEDQCFDRVYRLGQEKPVRIVKFVCNNTVEERMLELQERKRAIAKASLQRRSADERKQQTVDDLRKLVDF